MGRHSADDQPILDALSAGSSEKAIALFLQRYGHAVHAFILRMVRHRQLAEDVMQETLLQVVQNLHTLKDPASMRPWVYTIASHRALDALKKRARHDRRIVDPELMPDIADPGDVLAARAELAADVRDLETCLSRLPPRTRIAVLLRFGNEATLDEVAAILGERTDAVRMRIKRAMPRLKACMEAGGAHHD